METIAVWFSSGAASAVAAEIPYRVEYEPGGCIENNDGTWSVYTLMMNRC